ncbi:MULTISPECIES: hypothetical protein [unclassified Streptomyces]|uniref:hypothetical protein n=1 Tax=unclassified Streptomyces TaxID=2593676 RepID=UPI0037A06BB3
MLSYEDIVEAPLGKLKAAADDWSEVAANLDKLADQAADGMKEKAPMEDFLALHTTKDDSSLREDLAQAMAVGYGVGNDRENQQGVDPETG